MTGRKPTPAQLAVVDPSKPILCDEDRYSDVKYLGIDHWGWMVFALYCKSSGEYFLAHLDHKGRWLDADEGDFMGVRNEKIS